MSADRWEVAAWDAGDHVHVLPVGDLVPHSENKDGDCPCGTTTEPVKRADGSTGWLIIHYSLDNREAKERRVIRLNDLAPGHWIVGERETASCHCGFIGDGEADCCAQCSVVAHIVAAASPTEPPADDPKATDE